MHERVRAIFDEHESPTHCSRAEVLSAAKPLGAFVASFQRQTTELRALIMEAETETDLPEPLRGKLDFLHQTLAARDRIGSELLRIVREAASVQKQTDDVFASAKADVEQFEAGVLVRDAVGLPLALPSTTE